MQFSKSGMQAQHRFYLCSAGKYALLGMLKPRLQEPLFQLFDAGELLRQRSHRREDLLQLQRELAEALAAVELAWPCSKQDIKLHNWTHQGLQISRLGPSYVSAQWSFERHWHIMCQSLLNTARPASPETLAIWRQRCSNNFRLPPLTTALLSWQACKGRL